MIRVLDKNVADKIAAGEVVERPLSIVKELVENAIDAGSDSIIVEIKNGGKSYIRVTDNGCGIEAEEVLLAFKRHATSKIYTDSDLDSIETLGFRGEALASIAAVSRCELITKTVSGKTGTRVQIEGSEVVGHMPLGAPSGTTIIVSDLFYNTPARHKFMKSDASESSLIIDFISKMAIAYSAIKMRLINNGNILFSTQGRGDVAGGILTVYSSEIGKNLLPVSSEDGFLALDGFVSPQGYGKSNKKMQVFFVNGRNISSKTMEKGVSDAYSDKLTSGRYPACFLFLKINPEKLDVNIHPNKKEIRFEDDAQISAFIDKAINEALASKNALPEIRKENIFKYQEFSPDRRSDTPDFDHKSDPGDHNDYMKTYHKQVDINNLLSTMREGEQISAGTLPVQNAQTMYIKEETASFHPKMLDINNLSVTGSIFSTYITALDEDSLYLIDQHAAHERIFYEKLVNQYKNEEKSQQLLMVPFVINVSYAIKQDAFDWLDALRQTGFEIEEFGSKAFIVKAIPVFMTLEDAHEFIEQFLDNISETTDLKNDAVIEKIIMNACKLAVKANDELAPEEIRQLLKDLSKCENPYSCPHGRPTFIKLTKYEIEKMFKRV